MDPVTRKVCVVGDFGVGKTSTIARFVHQVFSEKYLTTVGVKIDTRRMTVADGTEIKLVIWDIAGTDRFSTVEFSYLRGASGYLVVVDGTRPHTLDVATRLVDAAVERYGDVPTVYLLNKADLEDDWAVNEEQQHQLGAAGAPVFVTSAKTGANVEEAMQALAEILV